jgi:CubicO group peptidase (beta-lactamase class C family)
LDKAIAARILKPLNFQSGIYNPLQAGRNLNTIVPTEEDAIWRKRRAWGEVHDENACGVGGVAGHAGIFATARDIVALGQAWLDDDSRLAIAPHILAQARQEQARNGFRFGLGWMLRAETDSSSSNEFSVSSYGHTGFTGTSLWIDPEQHLVVACLTNRVYPGREKAGIHEFRQALHAALARALRT